MSLKSKLIWGIAFLFSINIVLLSFFMYYIGKLANESSNVLKDNSKSLEFSKNLLITLDNINMIVFDKIASKSGNPEFETKLTTQLNEFFNEFDKSLTLERNNITENGEKELVSQVSNKYSEYNRYVITKMSNSRMDASSIDEYTKIYKNLKESIDKIYTLNMNTIVKKNNLTTAEAKTIITNSAILGSLLLIVAFIYFWYFPFYISNSLQILSNQAKALMQKSNKDQKMEDEMKVLMRFIDFTEKKFFSTKE